MPLPKTWTNPLALLGVFVVAVLTLSVLRISSSPSAATSANMTGMTMTVYKSPTCGCCENYITYLKRSGVDVDVITTTEMDAVKESNGVPAGYATCHTSTVGGYTVEGHIPLEIVRKLLDDKPTLSGIALPGMPSGSPGMPGAKQGKWSIYGWLGTNPPTVFLES